MYIYVNIGDLMELVTVARAGRVAQQQHLHH
jgi:hypothetical protein